MNKLIKAVVVSLLVLVPAIRVGATPTLVSSRFDVLNLETSVTQLQAVRKAESYLRYSAFSRSGLIDQLHYDGFSRKVATRAVDSLKVNWSKQAIKMGESYLRHTAFSRVGLIDQLVYEGFSQGVATRAVNSLKVNWNKQAAKMAESYLSRMAFSRSSLFDQLVYEGFTAAQATYGVNAVGL